MLKTDGVGVFANGAAKRKFASAGAARPARAAPEHRSNHGNGHRPRDGTSPPGQKEAAPAPVKETDAACSEPRAYSQPNGAQANSLNGSEPFWPHHQWCKASGRWSLEQWQAICALLFNGNEDSHEFLLCFKDEKPIKAKHVEVGYQAHQAYQTFQGTAEKPRAIGFYLCNTESRESCCGALDFDAHNNNERERALSYAAKAVRLVHEHHDDRIKVLACLSGKSGGWRVYFFADCFWPIAKWSVFLREIAQKIDAPVQSGVCEIFPNEPSGPDVRPHGILAPGCSKDCESGRVAFDTLTPALSDWLAKVSAGIESEQSATKQMLTCLVAEGQKRSKAEWKAEELRRAFIEKACARFAITRSKSRHERLRELMQFCSDLCGRELAMAAAAEQYRSAKVKPGSSIEWHLVEAAQLWESNLRKCERRLAPTERAFYLAQELEWKREAFLIMRNWSRATSEPDFYINCQALGALVGQRWERINELRQEFCEKGILRLTRKYVPRKWSARYEWIAAAAGEPRRREPVVMPKPETQWRGDPGDEAVSMRRHGKNGTHPL